MVLRLSPVQTLIVHKAAAYLSEQLGAKISIGSIDVSWFLNLRLHDIRIMDREGRKLVSANEIIVNPEKIDLKHHHLDIQKLSLIEANINLVKQQSDSMLNIRFLIDYFTSNDTLAQLKQSEHWKVTCSNLLIDDSHFMYHDECCVDTLPSTIDFADIEVSGLRLDAHQIAFSGDSVQVDIRELEARERSGFRLDHLSAIATASSHGLSASRLKVKTGNSALDLDLRFDYPNWNAFNDFIDSVRITSSLRESHLDMKDIACFAGDIRGMDNRFDVRGEIKGTVSSFKGKGMDIRFGRMTQYKGTISLNGLPDWGETFINAKIENFSTCLEDINHFKLPGGDSVHLHGSVLDKFGKIHLKGNFTGFYDDCVARMAIVTEVGNLKSDILLKRLHNATRLAYEGKIQAEAFNLGKLLDLPDFGRLNLDANLSGQGVSFKTVSLSANGNATAIEYKGNTISKLTVDGSLVQKKFSGNIRLSDQLVNLASEGIIDFTDSIPVIQVQAVLSNTKLARLHLVKRDSTSTLSTRMKLDFKGNSIDNILGSLRFDSTRYTEAGKSILLNSVLLLTSRESPVMKVMQVRSDVADAEFRGDYTFSDFSAYIESILVNYIPSLSNPAQLPDPDRNRSRFDYSIQFKDTRQITGLFIPRLFVSKNTLLKGSFDPRAGKVEITSSSPLIQFHGFSFRDWKLLGKTVNKTFHIESSCMGIDLSPSPIPDSTTHRLEQFVFTSDAGSDQVSFKLGWDDKSTADHNKSDISGIVSFTAYPTIKASFSQFRVIVNDTAWQLQQGNQLTVDSTRVSFTNFIFASKGQSLTVDGAVSHHKEEQIRLLFSNFDLSQFDFYFNDLGIDFDGLVNGSVTAGNLFAVPAVLSELNVRKFGFNHEALGQLQLKSSWNNDLRAIDVNANILSRDSRGAHFPLVINGQLYPEAKHNNLDLHATLENFNFGILAPFLSSVFSRFTGVASGTLSLTGDFSEPALQGKARISKSAFLVDYLKTTYAITGNVDIEKNSFAFRDVEVADSLGNKGSSSGTVYHRNFKEWRLDITGTANKLAALNTRYNPEELYYGHAFATGTFSLKGPVENLRLEVKARSEKGTSIHFPLSYGVSVSDNTFIVYVTPVPDTLRAPAVPGTAPSNISVSLNLTITRDAVVDVILPYEMGRLQGSGSGNIHIDIDLLGENTMHGTYTLEQGSFLFTFRSLFSRMFEIEKGSSITFNGSPTDADIRVSALYRTKAPLGGLPAFANDAGNSGRRIPLECMVKLSNNLFNPDIRFSLSFPGADAETQRRIFSSLDTTNQAMVNQQMISLLAINSFSFTGENSSFATSLGASSFSLISSQVSNWLSQLSRNFDVGINYRPNQDLSVKELEVLLSTQLFNNRVVIEGSFGRNGNAAAGSTAGASDAGQWVGDLNVEVKVTDDGRYRVRAFNRANNSLDPYTSSAPYTQGVGFLYRKEFDRLSGLFKHQKKKLVD